MNAHIRGRERDRLALASVAVAVGGITSTVLLFAHYDHGAFLLISLAAGPLTLILAVVSALVRRATRRPAPVAAVVAAVLGGGLTLFWAYFSLTFEGR